MKILPQREVLDTVSRERQEEAQEGVMLARQVEEIRRIRQDEEQGLRNFRERVIKSAKQELADIESRKAETLGEIADLEERRKRLIEPLDEAWEEVSRERDDIAAERVEIAEERENSLSFQDFLKSEAKRIDQSNRLLLKRENDTSRLFSEAQASRDVAVVERRKAEGERTTQQEEHNSRMMELEREHEANESLARILESRTRELEDREQSLNDRERALADAYATLERTKERISSKKR
jgi:hypothetical protein